MRHLPVYLWLLLCLGGIAPLASQSLLRSAYDLHWPEGVPAHLSRQASNKLTPELELCWQLFNLQADEQIMTQWLPHGMIRNGNKVLVEVLVDSCTPALLERLRTNAMELTGQRAHMLDGWIGWKQMKAICDWEQVLQVRPVWRPLTSIGSTTTQADAAMRTDLARTAFSIDGSGSKIGVLSDSYDNLGGANAGILTGDLPGPGNPNGFLTPVQVLQDLVGSGTDEGRGMIELIHDVAPGAELAFATAFGGQASFANNIIDLQQAGCDIIVDDVRFITDPFFQDGIIAQAVDSVVSLGATYFSAAGNLGSDSYEGTFAVTGDTIQVNFGTFSVQYELFDFGGGDPLQSITIPAGASASIILQWDDPFFSVSGAPGATSDLDLFLFNSTATAIIGQAVTANTGGDPVEVIQLTNTGATPQSFNLLIAQPLGTPAPGRVKTILFDALYDEFQTNSSTVYGQANAVGAIAVGAAFWGQTPRFGINPPLVEPFSSRGGTDILFDVTGNRLSPQQRLKPEITAPDGGNTSFFGADIGFDADFFPNFFGTSAAAPHAAAVAALLRQVDPTLQPTDILTLLQSTAIDMGTPGFDFDTGFGLINAEAAIQTLISTLPVTLISFDAQVEGTTALLEWVASAEMNLNGYEVLLTREEDDPRVVQFVPARNRQTELASYRLQLPHLQPGRYQVQLRGVDFDGSITLSSINILTILETPLAFVVFPEQGLIRVRPNYISDAVYTIELWDIQGRRLLTTPLLAQETVLNEIADIGSQLLFYRISSQDEAHIIQHGKILLR